MKTIATIIVLTGMAIAAFADSREVDDTYFHPAASYYIRGNTSAASNLVAQGLAEFPKDGKLKRLKELLDQQQQQNQQQQNQDNKDQQNQDQQDQQDQENKEQQKEQKDQNDQQGDQDQPQQDEQNPQQSEPNIPEQMSPDEAKRLLDAMKQEEKNKRLLLHPVMGAPVKVDKDW